MVCELVVNATSSNHSGQDALSDSSGGFSSLTSPDSVLVNPSIEDLLCHLPLCSDPSFVSVSNPLTTVATSHPTPLIMSQLLVSEYHDGSEPGQQVSFGAEGYQFLVNPYAGAGPDSQTDVQNSQSLYLVSPPAVQATSSFTEEAAQPPCTSAVSVVRVPESIESSVSSNQAKMSSPGRSSRNGYTCPHCGVQGIIGPSKLQLHIARMHSAPVVCKICEVSFVDKHCFILHFKNCFYICPKPGCNFHEKRKDRFAGHMRRHEYDELA